MSKKRNLFAGLICLVIAFVCLVSCVPVTETPEQAARTQAETDAQEVLGKIVWDDEDREAITASLSFPTENRNYPGVHIEWETSEEDVIAKNGKVTLLYDNDPRAYELKPEDDDDETKVIKVIVTATVYADYTWEENGTQTASTDPISKQFEFTVFAMPEDTDQGTIKEVKDRAWNFFYVENKAPKTLTTYQAKYYSVFVKGVVVGKLNGDTKGFFVNDGTDTIYVYGSNSSYQIGSKVQVFGQIYVYYGNLQIGSKVSTSFTTDVDVQPLEYERITTTEWDEQNKGLSDEVIGRFGGRALEVEGYLESGSSAAKDKYKLVDPATGVAAWIYYKSYDKKMEAELEAYVGKYVVLTGISYARDSRAVANQLLWTGKIEEAEAPVVTDETKVDVALNGITLKDTYTADFDLSDAGVWEVVSGTGIEIAEGVAKVTRGDEDQVVVLKVTVTSGEVSKSKEFTVTVKANVKETVKHAGTKEDPYTVSDAVLVAGALAADTPTEQVYAVGTIVSIKEVSAQYGNATFNISDGKKEIIVYRAKYLNNEKFTSEDQIKVGDTVLICGQLVNYKGDTLEFNSGCYIDSFVEDLPVEGNGTKENPYTVEQALEIAGALENKALSEEVYIIGTVSYIKEISTQYGNGTFNIKNGESELLVFRAKYLNNEKFTSADQIKVGDVVVICGQLTNWDGTLEVNSGCYIDSIKEGETPVLPEPPVVEPVEELKEGQAYKFQLVQAKAGKTVYFTGAMSTYYYATSEDINAGVDVYVEVVEGGYNLYFLDAQGAKHYMGIVASGDHVNAVFDNEKTVFTYDAELKTLKTVVNDAEYVFGTRNDNTYTTIGANKVSYDPFYVTFVVVGESTGHEHNYVDGKCECGAEDPNYTPVEPTDKEVTIAEALELADGSEVIIKGTVDAVEAWNDQYGNMNFTLKDATGSLYVFRVYTKVALGDLVTVEGAMGSYYGTRQIAQGATITITGHDDSYDQVVEGTTTITFDATSKRTVFTTEQQVWVENGITVTNNKASSTSDVADYASPARFYASSQLIIESEKEFTKITFKTNNKNFSSDFTVEGATVTVNGTECVIEFAEAVTSFEIATLPYQVRVSYITLA